ncbi:MAG: hypothetical protein EZS28_032524 [Streblomastix strix]|uniref:Uncharacterized protein n=1 Tax=Streblomastix strix TaxID=222440 RepID=A0A5J4UNF0_9EUKA|nr:MAG: hypothetical protein EZS28_032524 [Streblomastix strix]
MGQILEKQIGCVGPMSAEEQLILLQGDANRERYYEQSTISSQRDSHWALSDLQRKSPVLGPNDQWLKGFMGLNINPVEQKFMERYIERQKAVFANNYKRPMESLDPTEERASEEVRKMIRARETHMMPLIGSTQELTGITGENTCRRKLKISNRYCTFNTWHRLVRGLRLQGIGRRYGFLSVDTQCNKDCGGGQLVTSESCGSFRQGEECVEEWW